MNNLFEVVGSPGKFATLAQIPLSCGKFSESFEEKNGNKEFLGRNSPNANRSDNSQKFNNIRRIAKLLLTNKEKLNPSQEALERTKQAAKDFFSFSYQLLEREGIAEFPLANCNKCLGMVVIPTNRKNLVTIAISQDKNPINDERLRYDMVQFLDKLNQIQGRWVFELACIPTKAEYLLPRTLFFRNPQPAPTSSVEPHTRCVEVALMAALCKAGRSINFEASDISILAFGGTLWASNTGNETIPGFGSISRNMKYTIEQPLEIELSNSTVGYIDLWKPCGNHCEKYFYEMLAVANSGGCSSSFFDPRSEQCLPCSPQTPAIDDSIELDNTRPRSNSCSF